MEVVATVEEVFAELEEGESCRLLGEGKHSRVRRVVGSSHSRSFLLAAFGGIVGGLDGDLEVFGPV